MDLNRLAVGWEGAIWSYQEYSNQMVVGLLAGGYIGTPRFSMDENGYLLFAMGDNIQQ